MDFKGLKEQYQIIKDEIDAAIYSVISDTDFISGKSVTELEKILAEYVGSRFCVTCGNGTDALKLALMAWGIGPGDAVFVPDFTFFASGEVIADVGATPVFIDVEETTYNIDCKKLETAINKTLGYENLKPKVILAVDLFGQPADYIRINQIAQKYNLKVLEDSAQGFGGMINDQMACSFADISTTSFFPVKPFGCYGDGGAIFLNNAEEANLLRSYKNHGKGEHKYDNVRIGMNSRLDTLQAAILLAKFQIFRDSELLKINELAMIYSNGLANIVGLPYIKENFLSSWAQYTIRTSDSAVRDGLRGYLQGKNIPSMIYYPKPMHKQLAFHNYSYLYQDEDYEITNKLCNTVLSLPLHPYMKPEDILTVIKAVKEYMQN